MGNTTSIKDVKETDTLIHTESDTILATSYVKKVWHKLSEREKQNIYIVVLVSISDSISVYARVSRVVD